MVSSSLLLYLLRSGRCFYGGFISAMLIYFFYRVVSYEDPIRIPLSVAAVIFSSALKTELRKKCNSLLGHYNSLLVGYFLQALPLIIANENNLGLRGSALAFTRYFCLGFIPMNGEDTGVFEDVERGVLKQISREKGEDFSSRLYDRTGFIAQALGSLSFGYYLFSAMGENSELDEKLAIHKALIAFAFLSAASFIVSACFNGEDAQRLLAAA